MASVQATLIQTHASSEYVKALGDIARREQLVRSTFAAHRGAVRTVAATQAGLARAEAKAAAERVRGRNGGVAQALGRMGDDAITRMSLGAQDALSRVGNASRAVTPVIREAAGSALTNANMDLRPGEGEFAMRVVARARDVARKESHDARDRDIEKLGSTRDANVRQMRRASEMLVGQVRGQLVEVERALLNNGEAVAGLVDRLATSQIAAIDASERGALAFLARARVNARGLQDAGLQTAARLKAAAAAQAGTPGADARFQQASAAFAVQLGPRRTQLLATIDGVINRANGAIGQGLTEFQAECTLHRATAQASHATAEGSLAAALAGKSEQVREEWAKNADVFVISANSFAAAVESSRSQVIAELPDRFADLARRAILDDRKSHLRKFASGLGDAVWGLAKTVVTFVVATLTLLSAPFAFGIAALVGKAGALVGVLRDAAMIVVGIVTGFAERFRTLFRTWDEWPWYGKVAGLWATTLVALGDTVGLPSIFEGVTGRELISGRELSDEEKGAKTFGGGFAALTSGFGARPRQKVPSAAAAETAGAAEAKSLAAPDHAPSVASAPEPTPSAPGSAAAHAEQRVILQGADLEIAEFAKNVKPKPGTLDVFVHGELDDFVVIAEDGTKLYVDHRRLARYIKKAGGKYRRVRLISCKTGMHPKGAAQHLTNKLHVEAIEAPTNKVHIAEDGSMTIGPKPGVNTGTWEEFVPKKSSMRFTRPKDAPPERAIDRLHRKRAERAAGIQEPERMPEPAATRPPRSSGSKALGDEAASHTDDGAAQVADDAADAAGDAAAMGAAALSADAILAQATRAIDVAAFVDKIVQRAIGGVGEKALKRLVRKELGDQIELELTRVERQLADDAAWQSLEDAERQAALTSARHTLAEEAHRAATAAVDDQIAARQGSAGAGAPEALPQSPRTEAELRALQRARGAMDKVEAEALTEPLPRAKPKKGKRTTRTGHKRNNPADWREIRDSWDAAGYGDALSEQNRAHIARGRAPIVDEAWIRYFPGDASLFGETISIHHIRGSRLNVPLPFTRHKDAHSPEGTKKNSGGPGMTGSLDEEHQDDDDHDLAYA